MPPRWTREVKRAHQKLAGVTHANADGVKRQTIIRKVSPAERLTLEREPENAHDKYAVLVRRATTGEALGYLPSEPEAIKKGIGWCIPKRMDEGIRVEAWVKNVTGAGTSTLGVNIEMAFWHGPAEEQPPGPYAMSPAEPEKPRAPIREIRIKTKPATGSGCALVLFAAVALWLIVAAL
jgi:hypothetical protein